MPDEKLRAIAMYLPQFHPIPENDTWWGKGFTEWTNVAKAKPVFTGHYQPHIPTDLGFYDLRLAATREQQAMLAKENGISGFCYYHYWFNGKRLLQQPFDEVLASGKPDFPFMLCWANENWTRVWDGSDKDMLMEQHYSAEDDIAHIRSLIPAFKDPRYIKVDGKPVFIVYRSTLLPNIKETLQRWRNEALKEGIELYLCYMETFSNYGGQSLDDGFDAAIDFEPFGEKLEKFNDMRIRQQKNNMFSKWYVQYKFSNKEQRNELYRKLSFRPDYNEYVDFVLQQELPLYKRFAGVTPMWDNTARKKDKAFLFTNANPKKYEAWLRHETTNFKPFSKEENFIFINAWNEWAEGNHLEPCIKFGLEYLTATKRVMEEINS